jgi:hypothetical protein
MELYKKYIENVIRIFQACTHSQVSRQTNKKCDKNAHRQIGVAYFAWKSQHYKVQSIKPACIETYVNHRLCRSSILPFFVLKQSSLKGKINERLKVNVRNMLNWCYAMRLSHITYWLYLFLWKRRQSRG